MKKPQTTFETTFVTPTLAERWLKDRQYIVDGRNLQRAIKPQHVEELKQAMLRGEMVAANTKVQFCRCQGKYYNTDGQHTLHAIVGAGKTCPSFRGIDSIIETVACTDFDEVAHIFATRDIGIMRTHNDAMRASGISHEWNVSDQSVNLVGKAVVLLISGFTEYGSIERWKQRSRDIKIQKSREWMPLALKYFDYAKTHKGFTRYMRKPAMVAVGMCLIKEQEVKAAEFFKGVADDSGFAIGDPRKALREQLMRDDTKGGMYAEARYIACAWNAFYGKRILKIFRPVPVNKPIRLDGTIYDGENFHRLEV